MHYVIKNKRNHYVYKKDKEMIYLSQVKETARCFTYDEAVEIKEFYKLEMEKI